MATIHYYDIGDYLSREEKLKILADADGLQGIAWQTITPNAKHDWINQRGETFDTFISLSAKRANEAETVFDMYSGGVKTNRDAWVYNFSEQNLAKNMRRMIDFYNEQLTAFQERKKWDKKTTVERFIDTDPTKISWTVNLKKNVERGIEHRFLKNESRLTIYRPFTKHWLYYDRHFVERPGLWSQIFPEPGAENMVICVCGAGSTKEFSALITNTLPDLELVSKSQCFPYWVYDPSLSAAQNEMFPRKRRENISDAMLQKFRLAYATGSVITKEDIFYYVYGILHSESYKTRFAPDLKKQLPRIPMVDDFWTFSKAGRKLAALHLNYETLEPYPLREVQGVGCKVEGGETKTNSSPYTLHPTPYTVTQMKFPSKVDKSRIIYNASFHLAGIPAETYRYIVNGKSALEWIMERYAVTTHKDSGIVNDPNDWCREHNDERYIIDLVKRIVTLSVESVKIIDGLPELEF